VILLLHVDVALTLANMNASVTADIMEVVSIMDAQVFKEIQELALLTRIYLLFYIVIQTNVGIVSVLNIGH